MYNARVDELEPFIKAYWRALKEMWQGQRNNDRDIRILAKYGLGEVETPKYSSLGYYYGTNTPGPAWLLWNWELISLNKALR